MELTDQQSEILGIMFGDGSLSRTEHSVQIAITGNKFDDRPYFLGHVRPLFQSVFGLDLTSRYRPHENTMDLYKYSKEVAFTLQSWGMPIGLKKLARMTPNIPVQARAFIRGVFDTDGSVYRKYGTYAQIQFKTVSENLMIFIREKLATTGFHPTRLRPDDMKHRFLLCRQREVDMFFKLICPCNPKHNERLGRIRRPNA